MTKRYLVVGGAGYIGSHVVQQLADLGHEVVVFDNLSSNIDQLVDPRVRFELCDIRVPQQTLDFVSTYAPFDCVFHFAALKDAGASMENAGVATFAENNVGGSINLLNAIKLTGIKNIVFSSSAAVYGDPQYIPIDERHQTVPTNFYGASKLLVENLLSWYAKVEGINYASLRYFNAAGYDPTERIVGLERGASNLLPIIMQVATGHRDRLYVYGDDYDTVDGTGVRDYVHVADLVDAHTLAATHIENGHGSLTINLGTGRGYSVREVIEQTKNITGQNIPYKIVGRRKGDVGEMIASNQRAHDILGWQPRWSELEYIIRDMWNVYKRVPR